MIRDTAVYVFPGVGSYGTEFKSLLPRIRPKGKIVRYPNRYDPEYTVSERSFDDLVAHCVKDLTSNKIGYSVKLIGHSFGAYLAYSCAVAIENSGLSVDSLVVLGANSPSSSLPETPTSDEETLQYLNRIQPTRLQHTSAEWLEELVKISAQDIKLLQQFSAKNLQTVNCPIHCAFGESDPFVVDEKAKKWADLTSDVFEHLKFPGEHSNWLADPAFVDWLESSIVNSE